MKNHPFAVEAFIANQPCPEPPDSIDPNKWLRYYDALACWKAMKADCYKYGIREEWEN